MIQVAKIIPGGQALGTDETGKKIFFWNALPGESVVDYHITKSKSHYSEAIAETIDATSSHRVTPQDPCYLSTSPWQIMDYSYELKLKQELVVELFREHQIAIPTPPIITDNNEYHYRNKMEYALYWDNQTNQISLAFHQRGSHRKFPITKSSIERPEIFKRATEIIDELNHNREEARKYQSLLLRSNQSGEVSGGLYENHQPHPVFNKLTDKVLGHVYSYSPNGFFQINLPVYEMALTEIRRHINTNSVLDLYSGVGTIGLSVASTHNLTMVECDKFAFSEMMENMKSDQNSNNNVIGLLAKSEEALDYIEHSQTIILDPPRSGCDSKLIEKLNGVKPARIIYLSCNPATQARDIKHLLENYTIDNITTFNFFPRTPHIENLVVLSRSKQS